MACESIQLGSLEDAMASTTVPASFKYIMMMHGSGSGEGKYSSTTGSYLEHCFPKNVHYFGLKVERKARDQSTLRGAVHGKGI